MTTTINCLMFGSILGLPVLMTFMEGDEAFSSENLSDEQLLDIGTLLPIASLLYYLHSSTLILVNETSDYHTF